MREGEFHVGDCALCGEWVLSDDGSPYGLLIEKHRDGTVDVLHLSCMAKELGVSEQRADEYRPLNCMTDGQAAHYIDELMEAEYERQQAMAADSVGSFLNPDRCQRSLKR